jgi:hypothetical protein
MKRRNLLAGLLISPALLIPDFTTENKVIVPEFRKEDYALVDYIKLGWEVPDTCKNCGSLACDWIDEYGIRVLTQKCHPAAFPIQMAKESWGEDVLHPVTEYSVPIHGVKDKGFESIDKCGIQVHYNPHTHQEIFRWV